MGTGIDFSRSSAAAPSSNLFGRLAGGQPANTTKQDDRPKADLWLNVGYLVRGVPTQDGGVEDRFVSLPVGIPLDTMAPVSTKGNSESYRQFQAARNSLMEDLIAAGKSLQPGEDFIMEMEGGQLAIQIRRVAAEQGEVSQDNNPFARRFEFVAAADAA